MLPNIFLIGPMGVGKTTIGRHLARLLDMEFVDSDQEIESRTGVSIYTIFDIEGEPGFRERESTMLKELSGRNKVVIATGGGVIMAEENRQLLRKQGTVVYLHASVDTQVKRTRNSKTRPLLHSGDSRKKLAELMKIREPLYRQEADIIVNTDRRWAQSVAREISEKVQQHD